MAAWVDFGIFRRQRLAPVSPQARRHASLDPGCFFQMHGSLETETVPGVGGHGDIPISERGMKGKTMTGSPLELTLVLLLSATVFLSLWHFVAQLFG